MITELIVLLIGLLAGFADSTVGSGGLISIPALIFLGFPAQIAIGTDRLGSVGQTLGALLSFWKSKKIVWQYVPLFSLFALLGAFIGTTILLHIDPKNLQRIIGVILILALPLIFLKKIGIKREVVSKIKKTIGYAVYFLIMIYNGFFGTGSGPLATYSSISLFGLTIIESNATSTIPWFILSVVSIVVFIHSNIVNYTSGITLLVGMTIGGYLGAHTLIRIGEEWVKRLFIIVVIVSAIKLLFF